MNFQRIYDTDPESPGIFVQGPSNTFSNPEIFKPGISFPHFSRSKMFSCTVVDLILSHYKRQRDRETERQREREREREKERERETEREREKERERETERKREREREKREREEERS